MSIFQEPPFNVFQLFTTFGVSDSQVAAEFAAFDQFNTPEAIQQRQDDRDARREEIGVLSGELLASLKAECEAEKALVEIGDDGDVIFVRDGKYDQCETCDDEACLLSVNPDAQKQLDNWAAELSEIDQKDEYDNFEPSDDLSLPAQQNIDDELIKQYQSLLETWALHVIINGVVTPPGLINPTILAPPLLKQTAEFVYNSRIKPYNQAHSEFIATQQLLYEEYIKPENVQARLDERIARQPQVSGEILILEEELRIEKERIASIVVIPPEEDVVFISEQINDPDNIQDPVSFGSPALERIRDYIDYLLGEIVDLTEIDYLNVPASALEDTISRLIRDKLFEKELTIKNLEVQQDAIEKDIESIDQVANQEDTNLKIIQLQIIDETGNVMIASIDNIVEALIIISSIQSRDISVQNLSASYIHINELNQSQKNTFFTRLRSELPDINASAIDIVDALNRTVNYISQTIAQEQQKIQNLQPVSANDDVITAQGILREILNIEKSTIEPRAAINDEEDSNDIALEEVNNALSSLVEIDNFYELNSIIIKCFDVRDEIIELQAGVSSIDPTTQQADDLISQFENQTNPAYLEIRNRFEGIINSVSESDQPSIQNQKNEQKQLDEQYNFLINSFEQVKIDREENRNELQSGLESELQDVEDDLEEANNLTDDADRIYSYQTIVAIAERMRINNDSVRAAVSDKQLEIIEIKNEIKEKEEELASLSGDDIIFINEKARLEAEIVELENEIASIVIPDLGEFNMTINLLYEELINVISNKAKDLRQMINDLQFELDNPEFDPPFVPQPDPFDELLNGLKAIIFMFMFHLISYGIVVFFLIPPVIGTFSPALIADPTVEATAKIIKSDIESTPSIESIAELPVLIAQKIIFGLYFQASLHLFTYGTILPIGGIVA